MKKIITISREFGSAGGTIGKKVSEKLGFEYFDKEIIIQAARSGNLEIEQVLKYDEKPPMIFGFTQSLFELYSSPVEQQVYDAQKSIIKKIAENGNCVIVGRNANSILSEFDNSLHVFIHADEFWRVQYLKSDKLKEMPQGKISRHLHDIDKARQKFYSYYTNKEFGNADCYDMTLCSSSLGIDKCVELIVNAAQ